MSIIFLFFFGNRKSTMIIVGLTPDRAKQGQGVSTNYGANTQKKCLTALQFSAKMVIVAAISGCCVAINGNPIWGIAAFIAGFLR
jgi:hypothetical protein